MTDTPEPIEPQPVPPLNPTPPAPGGSGASDEPPHEGRESALSSATLDLPPITRTLVNLHAVRRRIE